MNLLPGVVADMSFFTVKYMVQPYMLQTIWLKPKSRPAHPISLCISCAWSTPATLLVVEFWPTLGFTKLQLSTLIKDTATQYPWVCPGKQRYSLFPHPGLTTSRSSGSTLDKLTYCAAFWNVNHWTSLLKFMCVTSLIKRSKSSNLLLTIRVKVIMFPVTKPDKAANLKFLCKGNKFCGSKAKQWDCHGSYWRKY